MKKKMYGSTKVDNPIAFNPILLLGIIICCNYTPLYSQSNEGSNFWFGFMEHLDIGQNTKVAMITSKFNTNGVISVPNRNWSQAFSVAANQVTLVELPGYTEVLGSETINDVGVHLTAARPVSVYIHQYHNARSEATVVLPLESIGNAYYAMTYRGYQTGGEVYPAEFLIVAVEDETEVMIQLSDESRKGKPAGSSFTINLNAGETFQVQAAKSTGDLTGSYLEGNKNFALFAGNRWTEVPNGCFARDNLLEQMYPLASWGRQFVSVPNAEVGFGIFRILAAEDNTEVMVHGSTTTSYNLNKGEFVEYPQSVATYIEANAAILVAQFSIGQSCGGHSVGDPAMLLLNSVEQTRDSVTLYSSSFENISENYINVIMRSEDVPFVLFDGALIDGNYPIQSVGLNDEFSYTSLKVQPGAHTIISDGCGVIATAYGYGVVESYAYSGGASFNKINENPIPEGGCLNDTIYFDTGLSPRKYDFRWDLGDGTMTTEAKFAHFYPDLGIYPVSLIIDNICLGTSDTLYRDLLISLRQAVAATDDVTVCEGEAFEMGATDLDGAKYEWIGPNDYRNASQFPSISNAQVNMSGDYSVIGIVSGCATFPATIAVSVIPTPMPYLGEDTIFCKRDSFIRLDPGPFIDYRWQDDSRQPVYPVDGEGLFWVEVADVYGCVGRDSVLLEEVCPTRIYVPNIFSPNGDGFNDQFRAYGFDIRQFDLRVFSRWGALVYQSNDPEGVWDGLVKGEVASEGVYVWMITLEGYAEDGEVYEEVLMGSLLLVY